MTETYSKSTDFGGNLDTAQLQSEITEDLNITVKVIRIDVTGDVVDIVFQSTISAGEKTTLDNIVAAHVPKTNSVETVKIQEEEIETGGHFQATTVTVNATKNIITSKTISWPIPISPLTVAFVSEATHVGDTIDLVIGEDTITGTITANVAPASAWVSQNYTVGQTVTYNTGDPDYGTRVYTCIANTVSNEVPTNTTYWRHGFEVTVSQTVIDNVMIGYFLKLDDLTNADSVGCVLYIDKTNLRVYADTNPTNSFSAVTPTYVRQTVYMFKDYEIGPAWEYIIGRSKIGGSYIPVDTKITVKYDNKSTINDKVIVGTLEFLY